MGCCHKRREVVAEGAWKRKKPTIVKTDTLRVSRCKTCGAIRVDSYNEFCFSKGVWSLPANAAGSSVSDCSGFDAWWHNEGSGIVPRPDDDMESHAHRVAEIAWKNSKKGSAG
jgi:hypothetical protein